MYPVEKLKSENNKMGASKNTVLHFPTSKLDWPWILS